MSKCILAYSGGLDATVAASWLKEKKGLTVIAYCCDVGQGYDLAEVGERALAAGAASARVDDLREQFVRDFVSPAFRAGATYGEGYLLCCALARPLIARELVRVAVAEGAQLVAHCSSVKGNNQVRLDAAVKALAPQVTVIEPPRDWEMKSREEVLEYARKHALPVPDTGKKPYLCDRNLWGQAIECAALEDPWAAPPDDAYTMTRRPSDAPDEASEVEVEIEGGLPCGLNGKRMSFLRIIEELGALAGSHGVGRVDSIEDRVVGIKSRFVYEMPAATVLYQAKKALEAMVLPKDVLEFQRSCSDRYGQLAYNGQWFSELREALDGFFERTCRFAAGQVRVRLHKGACVVTGRKSPFSLYDESLATCLSRDAFDHAAAAGFVKLWSLPLQAQAARKGKQ